MFEHFLAGDAVYEDCGTFRKQSWLGEMGHRDRAFNFMNRPNSCLFSAS